MTYKVSSGTLNLCSLTHYAVLVLECNSTAFVLKAILTVIRDKMPGFLWKKQLLASTARPCIVLQLKCSVVNELCAVLWQNSQNNFYTIIDLPEGTHHYRFMVDGQWRCDPKEVCVIVVLLLALLFCLHTAFSGT